MSIDYVALYSDGTRDYRNPTDPMPETMVEILFRGAIDNLDSVNLLVKVGDIENSYPMTIKEEIDGFVYYKTCINVGTEELFYIFEVRSGEELCYYTDIGPVYNHSYDNSFRIMPGFTIPDWAQGAVMYQIFTDRFCNGDTTNDVETREYYYNFAHSDAVEFWGRYPSPTHVGEFYGGDLQGVMDKLDYLKDLGVEAIYFNPLFVSPSYHKYDTEDYDYIDPHFGVVKEVQGQCLDKDDSNNRNATRYISKVTKKVNLEASNELFIKLVEEAHKRDIRIIIDGVFNHCGSYHKWMDREGIYEEGGEDPAGAYRSPDSPYRTYFNFHDQNGWPDNGSYDGWWGFDTLPKLNYEGSKKLQDEIIRIARKWVSPPFNVDGWRLDVAADLGNS